MEFWEPRLERAEVLFFAVSDIAAMFESADLGRAHEGSHIEARAIDRAERRRRHNEMDGAAKAFGLAGNGHANNGADLMTGGVVGWQSGTDEKNHGNVPQSRASFHDRAQIFAGDLPALALCLSENYVGGLAAQNVERLFCLETATT
jgi:hypothetical protein